MFDRNSVIAIALIFLIFVVWSFFFTPTPTPVTEPQQSPAQDSTVIRQDTVILPTVVQPVVSAGDSVTVAVDSVALREISVETQKYRAIFSNRGAGLVVLELKDYRHGDSGRVQMLGPDSEPVPVVMSNVSGFSDRNLVYRVDGSDLNLTAGGSQTLTFSASVPGRGEIVKEFTFYADRYDFDLKVKINGVPQFGLDREYILAWLPGLPASEENLRDDYGSFKGGAHLAGEMQEVNSFDGGKLEGGDISGTTTWVGSRTKYFAYALIPQNLEGVGAYFRGSEKERVGPSGNYTERTISAGIIMASGANAAIEQSFKIFAGPLDYHLLKQYNLGLQDFIDWGWKIIKPFSMAIYWLTYQLGRLIPNYGVVIIIIAILLKLVTYPLTRKSLKSMQAMRNLAPKMEELKAKYKSDPQKLNQAMMKLYKEEGVNPFSGCLLLLPQMPLLYGLYTVFRSTIELRQAYFIPLWPDLSQPDKLYIMPVLMVIAMFFQQKMSMTDPKQKFMIYLFPAMFFFFMFGLPTGLVLYWTVYSVLSIFEQIYIKRTSTPLNPQVR